MFYHVQGQRTTHEKKGKRVMKDCIQIQGIYYNLGFNLRTRVIYERITGKPMDENMGTFENIVFFYSILCAFNRETFRMTFDEFFDLLNEHEELYTDLLLWIDEYSRRRLEVLDAPSETDKKKE